MNALAIRFYFLRLATATTILSLASQAFAAVLSCKAIPPAPIARSEIHLVIDATSSGALYPMELKKDKRALIVSARSQEYKPEIARGFTGEGVDLHIQADYNLSVRDRAERIADDVMLIGKKIKSVVVGYEGGVELTNMVAEALIRRGVPLISNGENAAYRHKDALYEDLENANIPGLAVAARGTFSTVEEAIAFGHQKRLFVEHGGPGLVVKPVDGASSEQVESVRTPEQLRVAFEEARKTVNRYGQTNHKLLVMEYLEGPEYVINTVRGTSPDGTETIDKLTDAWLYTKWQKPSGMKLYLFDKLLRSNDLTVRHLFKLVKKTADVVGYKMGPMHAEIIMTARGPVIIDVGFRAMGSGQPRLVKAVTGRSQISLHALAINNWNAFKLASKYYSYIPGKEHATLLTIMARKDGHVGDMETIAKQVKSLSTFSRMSILFPTGKAVEEAKKLSDNVAQVELIAGDDKTLMQETHLVLDLPWVIYEQK